MNLRFPGQYYDTTSLYYNLNRYYNPLIGRYMEADPIGMEGGWNPYAYAGNDPVNKVDPDGLNAIKNGAKVIVSFVDDIAKPLFRYAKESIRGKGGLRSKEEGRRNQQQPNNQGNTQQQKQLPSSAAGPSKAEIKGMMPNAESIARGQRIDKVDELVEKFGGRTKDWQKMKGWDSKGQEWHWYQNNGRKVGWKHKGEHDPF